MTMTLREHLTPPQLDRLQRQLEVCDEAGRHEIWNVLCDPVSLRLFVEAAAASTRQLGVTHVCGPESRGFLLGGLLAHELGVGFVPARKAGRYLPGAVSVATSRPDWEGKTVDWAMRDDAVGPGDRVAVVDDWLTTGNQIRAIRGLIEARGAHLVAVRVLVTEGVDGLSQEGIDLQALLRWNGIDGRYVTGDAGLA